MSLSFCSNWESLQHLNSQMLSSSSLQQAQVPQLDEDFFIFNNNGNEFPETFINPFLRPADDLFYPDSYANLLPYFSSASDSLVSLSPETFLLEDFDSYQLPKQQKSYINDYDSKFGTPNILYGYVPNPALVPEFLSKVPAPPTEFQIPARATFSCGKTENVKKPNGASLSVQSIAARERRRKITEKTRELGKLIPGGHRMNTAEMFQAASKYVKFLQAQFKLLQLMESKKERKEPFHAEELQTVVASPRIQEKLYTEDKCLIPKEFIETLANDPEIQSKPTIVEGIDQLLRTNGQS